MIGRFVAGALLLSCLPAVAAETGAVSPTGRHEPVWVRGPWGWVALQQVEEEPIPSPSDRPVPQPKPETTAPERSTSAALGTYLYGPVYGPFGYRCWLRPLRGHECCCCRCLRHCP